MQNLDMQLFEAPCIANKSLLSMSHRWHVQIPCKVKASHIWRHGFKNKFAKNHLIYTLLYNYLFSFFNNTRSLRFLPNLAPRQQLYWSWLYDLGNLRNVVLYEWTKLQLEISAESQENMRISVVSNFRDLKFDHKVSLKCKFFDSCPGLSAAI